MKNFERYRILVMPDHPTPLAIRTHTADPVPYVIYPVRKPRHLLQEWRKNEVYPREGMDREASVGGFDEVSAKRSGIFIERGFELIERFLTPSAEPKALISAKEMEESL
jgi:2,3-bisphosphoglycerate-independent phosphoglycerate mutase